MAMFWPTNGVNCKTFWDGKGVSEMLGPFLTYHLPLSSWRFGLFRGGSCAKARVGERCGIADTHIYICTCLASWSLGSHHLQGLYHAIYICGYTHAIACCYTHRPGPCKGWWTVEKRPEPPPPLPPVEQFACPTII